MSHLLGFMRFCRKARFHFIGAMLISVLPAFSQEIEWIRNYSEGMKLARESGRPVLVDFWSEWCIPCKQMDKEVYTDRGLREAARAFVLIRVDVDNDPATALHFGIKALPMKLFLNPREAVLLEVKGYTNASELLEKMRPIPKDFEPIKESAKPEEVQPRVDLPAVPWKRMVEPIPGKLSNTVVLPGGGEYAPPTSIVDLPIADLLQQYPQELADVEFDKSRAELASLLEKAGKKVTEFLANMPNTVSKEQIRQERLRPDGKVETNVEQEVSYLLLLRPPDGGALWEEARTNEKGKPVKLKRLGGESFLTSGYAMECVLLAPNVQVSSRFRYIGRQSSEPYAHVIAFAQRTEVGVFPGEFRMDGVSVPLFGQGLAWVDPRSYQIIRMRTDLLEPQPQVHLARSTTEISYQEYRFGAGTQSFWLPREVVVTIGYRGRVYRNTHRYSDYKLFSVESYEKREPISAPRVIK